MVLQEVISRGTELETELSQDITPTETKTISNFNSKVCADIYIMMYKFGSSKLCPIHPMDVLDF